MHLQYCHNQGGLTSSVNNPYINKFPISFKKTVFIVIPIDTNLESNPLIFGTHNYTLNGFTIAGTRIREKTLLWFRYIALGI